MKISTKVITTATILTKNYVECVRDLDLTIQDLNFSVTIVHYLNKQAVIFEAPWAI